jgi:putative endonuclease
VTARRFHAGLSAEETAARAYEARGAEVLARRWRTAEGEADLVLRLGAVLVVVEVKQRRRPLGADPPVSARQWRRVAAAAGAFLAAHPREGTGGCRFDAAIMLPGGRLEIVEDAWRPEEF